ncbi:MAG: OmpA family protein, partial [Candidatus Kapaibacterium sp.]
LSKDRAKSVVNYLTQHGIDTTRLSAIGYGAAKPVAPNATEEGRAKNRRVEFILIPK